MNISVVIIGRNSSSLLKKNYVDRNFTELDFSYEIIYVDSDSSDDSVAIAKKIGWKTVSLSSKGRLSAAAGRYVGTLEASGDYVLYLDSDMVLKLLNNKNIHDILNQHIKVNVAGVGGLTKDVFFDGKQRDRLKRNKDGEKVDTFGGFVLLDRKKLLEVGNWNPNVIANEENELYARLLKHNYIVVLSREMTNFHYTDNPKPLKQLFNLYFPSSAKARKFYGAPGMGLMSAIKQKSVFEYLYYFNSETILMVFYTLLALLVIFSNINIKLKIAIILLEVITLLLWIRRKRSLLFVLLCPSYFIQLIVGVFKYQEKEIIIK